MAQLLVGNYSAVARPIIELTEQQLIELVLFAYTKNGKVSRKISKHIAQKLVDRRRLLRGKK